jgi:hypothetical protein
MQTQQALEMKRNREDAAEQIGADQLQRRSGARRPSDIATARGYVEDPGVIEIQTKPTGDLAAADAQLRVDSILAEELYRGDERRRAMEEPVRLRAFGARELRQRDLGSQATTEYGVVSRGRDARQRGNC